MNMGKHGITTETPKNILLGAGTYHRGLKWEGSKWSGECIGATNGGGKVDIAGEFIDLEVDGMMVLVKGMTVKAGGRASMETSLVELSGDSIKLATNFKQEESDADGYDMFIDKAAIEEGDYCDNFGFVGKTANGAKDIIIIFESALCKSAFTIEPKNKEQSVLKIVMECYAENAGDLDTLPIKIYYPSATMA